MKLIRILNFYKIKEKLFKVINNNINNNKIIKDKLKKVIT